MKLTTPITSCSGDKMSSSIAGSREKKKFAHTESWAAYKSNTARKFHVLSGWTKAIDS